MYVAVTEAEREAVRHAQLALGMQVTGVVDDAFRSRVRGLQILYGLRPTGLLDRKVAGCIDRMREYFA